MLLLHSARRLPCSSLHTASTPHAQIKVLVVAKASNTSPDKESTISNEDSLLSWSVSEDCPAAAAPLDDAAAAASKKQKPRRQQQATQQQTLEQPHQADKQQQQRTQKHGSRVVQRASADAASKSTANSSSSSRRSSTAQGPSITAAAADPYREAQQRVRAVLAAADLSNPTAAAEQLPATVNDLTTALQLLATAPRPTTPAAYRKFDAAVKQLAAAVLHKYKQMLLGMLPATAEGLPAPPQQHHQQQQQQDEQEQLAAALATLPGTKLAAVTFSLGVLRLYDSQLVQALEAASLQLLQEDSLKPNQLGQIVQGFAYLDHALSPAWHAALRDSSRCHLPAMQGPQLASLAVWLTTYGLCGGGSAAGSTNSRAAAGADSSTMQTGTPGHPFPADTTTAAAAAGIAHGAAAGIRLDPAWVQAYLAAVGRNAPSLKPLQLAQVLQAAAGLWQDQQHQQQAVGGDLSMAGSQGGLAGYQAVLLLQGIPVDLSSSSSAAALRAIAASSAKTQAYSSAALRQLRQNGAQRGRQQQAQHSRRPGHAPSSSSSNTNSSTSGPAAGSSWVLPLVAALQQRLPDFTMAHLGWALPALLSLTHRSWPQQLLLPLLLQVKLLLPGSSGKDLVTVAQAVAHVAGPDALAADRDWCDALVTQLHAQLPTLGPSDLAGAVRVVSLLRVKPYKAWVYALCQRLRVDAKAMDVGDGIIVLEGLSQIGVQLDPEVLHVFVLGVKRWMGAMSEEQLARVIAALRRMYPKVLPGRTVQSVVEELQRRQQFLALQSRQQQSHICF